MGSKEEIKASLEVDFSKVQQRLQDADQAQKREDEKADALQRRTDRIVERLKDAGADAQRLESKVGNRIEDMLKDFGKFTTKAVIFDTLTNVTDFSAGAAGPLAGIATTALAAGASSGNPFVGLLAGLAKSIDALRDSQRAHQQEIKQLRDHVDQLDAERLRLISSNLEKQEEQDHRLLQRIERVRTEISKEGSELLIKTWQMTGGVD